MISSASLTTESSETSSHPEVISVSSPPELQKTSNEIAINESSQQDQQPTLLRPKTPATEKILAGTVSQGLSPEDIVINQVVRENVVPLENKIVPGSINKGNDISSDISFQDYHDSQTHECLNESITVLNVSTTSPISTRKLPFDEKIVAGSFSRGESPELVRPTTPKTPHSEKILAGVVTLQEKSDEFEKDEIIIVDSPDNIPM